MFEHREGQGNIFPVAENSGSLRLPYAPPSVDWEKYRDNTPESTREAIGFVQQHAWPLRMSGVYGMLTEWEGLGGLINVPGVDQERREIGYYDIARKFQTAVDDLFSCLRPHDAQDVKARYEHLFGSMDYRWHLVHNITHIVSELVGEPPKNAYGPGKVVEPILVYGRAKSNFAIWAKCQQYAVDPGEIWDTIGVQVITVDTERARHIHEGMLNYAQSEGAAFTLAPREMHHHPKKRLALGGFSEERATWHEPVRDYLDDQQDYRSARANYIYEDPFTHRKTIWELQATPVEVLKPPKSWQNNAAHKR